tara:strand:+ start:78 stop:605 length:528 start_codon:yes stop_codon:yes gene_type:complete
MKIKKTKFKNTFILEHKKKFDKRGFFMRGFCNETLKKKNLNFKIKQTNFSFNKKKFTLRGFHYQVFPFSEDKIITCINGSILLVLVNINKKSPNYLENIKIKLTSKMNRSVLISKNCATAFLTLESKTLIFYYMSNYYKKNKSMGIRYNDPKLKIKWPNKVKIISNRDLNFKNIF